MAAQQKGSLLSRFGGSNTNVDFTPPADPKAPTLPLPTEDDDFLALHKKLREFARVVESGRSVAVASGYKGAKNTERDPLETAKMSMTQTEIMQLEAYDEGLSLPVINWQADRAPPPKGHSPLQTAERRALALNRLYKVDVAVVENAVFFMKTYPSLIPLLTAVVKIIGAQRDLTNGFANLDEMQVAEIQTIGRITATTQANINHIQEEVRKLLRDINYSQGILLARSHALKELIPEYKKKKDPVNDLRKAVGRPAVGRTFDYRAKASGARVERTNFLRGTGLASTNLVGGRRPTWGGAAAAEAGEADEAEPMEEGEDDGNQ